MGLLSDVMRALIAQGATPELLLAASEAAEASMEAKRAADEAGAARRDEERRERRRQGNRERQARYYNRHFRDNADNAVIDCDNAPNAVMQREEREVLAAKGPQTPKNKPLEITSSLPSEAQVPSAAKPRRHVWPDDYRDRFWAAYPRRTDRKKAMAVLDRIYRQDSTPFQDLIDGAHRLAESETEAKFLPHPTTWLNGERWKDEIPVRPPPGRSAPRTSARDEWAADAIASHESLMRKRDEQRGFSFDEGQSSGADDQRWRDASEGVRERPEGQLVVLQHHGHPGRRRALG